MYGKLNVNEYVDGQHLWYETCFGNGKFILVVDRHNKYDVRDLPSLAEKPHPLGWGSSHSPNIELSPYSMIQMVDETEVIPISIESHPEYYFREGIRNEN